MNAQHPTGTSTCSPPADLATGEAARQWTDAWVRIAETCEDILADMHPAHPRRAEMESLGADARLAAQPTIEETR
jgi:hypothetical protein